MSYTLKLSILNELIKMGKLNSVFGFDGNFTQEQLDSITSLQLTDCDSNKFKIRKFRKYWTN